MPEYQKSTFEQVEESLIDFLKENISESACLFDKEPDSNNGFLFPTSVPRAYVSVLGVDFGTVVLSGYAQEQEVSFLIDVYSKSLRGQSGLYSVIEKMTSFLIGKEIELGVGSDVFVGQCSFANVGASAFRRHEENKDVWNCGLKLSMKMSVLSTQNFGGSPDVPMSQISVKISSSS